MARRRRLPKYSNAIRFLRNWKMFRDWNRERGTEEDRELLERDIRIAMRKGDKRGIRLLAERFPIRPLYVPAKYIRLELEGKGFIFIPGSHYFMLPPANHSRREAKKIRDGAVQAARKAANAADRRARNRTRDRVNYLWGQCGGRGY